MANRIEELRCQIREYEDDYWRTDNPYIEAESIRRADELRRELAKLEAANG